MTVDNQLPLPDFERYPGFTCFKSSAAIHYPRRWQRDALIQAALDPSVDELGPMHPETWPEMAEFGFYVSFAGHRFACLLHAGTTVRSAQEVAGLPPLWISRAALKMEPLLSTGRAIWSKKRLSVSPAGRYLALEMASSRVEGVPAKALLEQLSTASDEPVDQLLAMIAQGILQGDIGGGLNGRTLLRPTRNFESKDESTPRDRLRQILIGPS